jgi:hypothetical protein
MTINVTISKPIKDFEGVETTNLVFQEPTFADLIKMENASGGSLQQSLALFTSCSEYAESELKKISAKDTIKIGNAFAPFLPSLDDVSESNLK